MEVTLGPWISVGSAAGRFSEGTRMAFRQSCERRQDS